MRGHRQPAFHRRLNLAAIGLFAPRVQTLEPSHTSSTFKLYASDPLWTYGNRQTLFDGFQEAPTAA